MTNQSTKSDFNVEVVRITNVLPHPNADRLEQYETTAGYPILDTKGKYKVGDLAVYVPVDAVVPLSNPAFTFLRSKLEQETARIGARRLRGIYSEGLLVQNDLTIYTLCLALNGSFKEGDNVQDALGITRYVNPNEIREGTGTARPTRKGLVVREMPVYGLDSLVRFKDAIPIGTPVVITEKIHGCNARYMFKDGRLYVGSHKVMRGDTGSPWKARLVALWRRIKFWGNEHAPDNTHGDIWWKIAEQYHLKRKLSSCPGLTFYGEIYGKGLQVRGGVDFCYDSPDGLKFRVFDIWDASAGRFLAFKSMSDICKNLGLEISPCLLDDDWQGIEQTNVCLNGLEYCSNKAFPWRFFNEVVVGKGPAHMREGWVVRTDVSEADPNRKTFKWVSPEYKLLGETKGEK